MTGKQLDILILEDETIVALDLEATLEDAGHSVPAVCSTNADALEYLKGSSPDAVILDFELADGPSLLVAEELSSRNIPFIVFTGRSEAECQGTIFREGIWVPKPSPIKDIVAALQKLRLPVDQSVNSASSFI